MAFFAVTSRRRPNSSIPRVVAFSISESIKKLNDLEYLQILGGENVLFKFFWVVGKCYFFICG
jgi:hypothetical protein